MFKTKLEDYLPTGNGMFSRLEYFLVPLSLCIYLFVLLTIKIIIWIISKIKNIAYDKALTVFEKYRIKQDKLYKSDFDNFLNEARMIKNESENNE